MRWKGVEWIDLAHGKGKLTGCCEYNGEPLGSIHLLTTCGSSPLFSAAELWCSRLAGCVRLNVTYCSAAATWHRDKQRLKSVVCGRGE
jgi:hypothetical protein